MTLPAPTQADLAVRLRRAAFNQALVQGDLAAIGPILAPDVVLVTGTDSAVIHGRKAQLLAWKREFAAPQRTLYVRQCTGVEASAVEPIALEQGQWQGQDLATGTIQAQGRYSAKWRRIGADWMLVAEIFVTMA